jgi:hypothetical protein
MIGASDPEDGYHYALSMSRNEMGHRLSNFLPEKW